MKSPQSPFQLRSLVRDVIDRSDEVQPEKLARLVADAVPETYIRAALAETLESYVRVIVDRRRAVNPIVGWNPVPGSTISAKVIGIRDAWLKDRVHIGNGSWKRLGDCTYSDLMFAAIERRRLARLNNDAADRYEALAKVVRGRGVDTVSELPPSDLLTLTRRTPT